MVSITTGKLNANSMETDGEYLFFTCDSKPFRINTYAFNGEAITISGNGSQVGHLNYYIGKFNAYQRTYVLMDFGKIIGKFLYHYLAAYLKKYILDNSKKGSVPYITLPMLTNFKVPIPPIEVQEEIVRILDKFGELEVELEARKSQYEFWRGKLIDNIDGTCGKLINLLSRPITDGPHTTPKLVSEGIPFISATAIHEGKVHLNDAQGFITKELDEEYSKKYKPQKWDVYMVKSGSTTGKVAIVDIDDDFNIWSPLAAMRTNSKITSRYLYHLLQTNNVQKQVQNRMSHGSQPNLSMRVLEQFDVKIPNLEEQERIVNILDKFDKLVNDISVGLPAEIEARKKQYEYYRNKLLSFEEVSCE